MGSGPAVAARCSGREDEVPAVVGRTRSPRGDTKPRSAGWLGCGDGRAAFQPPEAVRGLEPRTGAASRTAVAGLPSCCQRRRRGGRTQGAREAGTPPHPAHVCQGAAGVPARGPRVHAFPQTANELFPVGAWLSARGSAVTATPQRASRPRASRAQMLSGRLTPRGRLDGRPPLPERREAQEEPRARPRAPLALPDHVGRS